MSKLFIKETYYNDICVTYHFNGMKSLTKMHKGYLARRRYCYYTTKDCLKMFRNHLKTI